MGGQTLNRKSVSYHYLIFHALDPLKSGWAYAHHPAPTPLNICIEDVHKTMRTTIKLNSNSYFLNKMHYLNKKN